MKSHTVGLMVGSFAAFAHLLWAALVGFGIAQAFLDWIYGLHFLNNPFTVSEFRFGQAALLVIVAFVVGYGAGWMLATIGNLIKGKTS